MLDSPRFSIGDPERLGRVSCTSPALLSLAIRAIYPFGVAVILVDLELCTSILVWLQASGKHSHVHNYEMCVGAPLVHYIIIYINTLYQCANVEDVVKYRSALA